MKINRIIFATGNKDKIREASQILEGFDVPVISMKDAGVAADPEENGTTFEQNALIKARAVAKLLAGSGRGRDCVSGDESGKGDNEAYGVEKGTGEGMDGGEGVIADDSGLVIDYLNGEPGIYSARYMGHDTSYHEKNASLISRLEGVPDDKRTARFTCAIAAVLPDGTELTATGNSEGSIGYEEKGEHGFGYDPIFYLPDLGLYSAELSDEEKNARSHRGQALRAMKDLLEERMV